MSQDDNSDRMSRGGYPQLQQAQPEMKHTMSAEMPDLAKFHSLPQFLFNFRKEKYKQKNEHGVEEEHTVPDGMKWCEKQEEVLLLTDEELNIDSLKKEFYQIHTQTRRMEEAKSIFPIDYARFEDHSAPAGSGTLSEVSDIDSDGFSISSKNKSMNLDAEEKKIGGQPKRSMSAGKLPEVTMIEDDIVVKKPLPDDTMALELIGGCHQDKIEQQDAGSEKGQRQNKRRLNNKLASLDEESQSDKEVPGQHVHLKEDYLVNPTKPADDAPDCEVEMDKLSRMMDKLRDSPKGSKRNDSITDPETIKGFRKLPIDVQGMIRQLTKPKKLRNESELTRVKNFIASTEYFKGKKMDEKTMTAIAMASKFSYTVRNDWVFKTGDAGDCIYIILHGHCKIIEQNKDFLNERRNLREQMLKMYKMIEDCYLIGKDMMGLHELHPKVPDILVKLIKKQRVLFNQRKKLKVWADALERMSRFCILNEYNKGGNFGELALKAGTKKRHASINAARSSYFAIIDNETYENYIKKFDKRQGEKMVNFYKQIPFMSCLSQNSIMTLEYSWKRRTAEQAGHVFLYEGAPVSHVALVMSGEFEVVKKSVRGLDDKIMSFLTKGEVRKRIASKVLLLPGRSTVYQKTASLIPPFERTTVNNFQGMKEEEVEKLAFNSVSEELYGIAQNQLEHQAAQNVSLTQMRKSAVDKYKDIRLSIQGTGFIFGDYECHTKQQTYGYSLRAANAGAVCVMMDKDVFNDHCRQFRLMGEQVAKTVFEKEMQKMKQLTRIVFNRWYSDLLQENLKVVPDLDGSYKSGKKQSEPPAKSRQGMLGGKDSQSSPDDIGKKGPKHPSSPAPKPTVRKKVPVHLHPEMAKDIVQQSGANWDMRLISDYEGEKSKLRLSNCPPINRPVVIQQESAEDNSGKPKEKLQNQLNTICPMEIVRAQPFFSRKVLTLRDQLKEYVQGFPATSAHRQIIAKAYNMEPGELGEQASDSDMKNKAANKGGQSSNKKEKRGFAEQSTPNTSNEAQMQIQKNLLQSLPASQQEMPVDPERLKKAIRIALIKNGNQPEKIDIQSIMREQIRIFAQISEYKQSTRKQSNDNGKDPDALKRVYVSSRIIKKIAEDHIHSSLKKIISAAEQGDIQLSETVEAKAHKRYNSVPSKFQKILHSKYNTGFTSIFDPNHQFQLNTKTRRSSSSQAPKAEEVTITMDTLEIQQSPKSEIVDKDPEITFNKITHQTSANLRGGSDYIQLGIANKISRDKHAGILNSNNQTQYTFFSGDKNSDVHHQKSKMHLQQHFNGKIASTARGSSLCAHIKHSGQEGSSLAPLKFMGRQLPMKDAKRGRSDLKSRFADAPRDFNLKVPITTSSFQMNRKNSNSGNKHVKLAALFQPGKSYKANELTSLYADDTLQSTDLLRRQNLSQVGIRQKNDKTAIGSHMTQSQTKVPLLSQTRQQ